MCVRETFTYPLFCKYVVNIEMLGEVMHLASEQSGGVAMDILPGGGAMHSEIFWCGEAILYLHAKISNEKCL